MRVCHWTDQTNAEQKKSQVKREKKMSSRLMNEMKGLSINAAVKSVPVLDSVEKI